MDLEISDHFDFKRLNELLENFNQATGFVTAILDLEGNVLSKSGWREICTDFHRVNKDTAKKCKKSDTILANNMDKGEEYYAYKCMNGLIDVVVPIVIKGEHFANLFTGQFFFEEPSMNFFKKQAKQYDFDLNLYLSAVKKVPVVSEAKVKVIMKFLVHIIEMISDLTIEKMEQQELNSLLEKSYKEIKSKKQRLTNIIDGADVGTWEWNVQTEETILNEEWAEMLGYTLKELSPTTVDIRKKFTHPEDLKKVKKVLEEHFNGEIDQYKAEIRMKHKDGHWVWIQDQGKVITWTKDGEPEWVYGTSQNITERKQAEEQLKASEEKFKSYIQNAPDGIFIADENGKYIEVNKAACEITGYSEEELLNLTIPELTQDEYIEKTINHFQTVNKYGFASGELGFITKSGERRFWNVEAVKLSEARFLGFVKDITERKKAKEAVKKSEQRYKAIFENTGTATCIIEKDMTISKINKEFEELSGYTKEEVEGNMKWTNFVVQENLEKMKKYHKARRKGETAPTRYEFGFVGRDKEKHHILLDIDMIPGTNKSVASMLDITERKQMEELLQYKTFHDELTGLYNRAYFNEEMKRYDNKRQLPLSVILGDVNGLKIANDTFGHKEGDKLLKSIAQIIENSCRQEDLVARTGGDEFVILLPQTSKKEAKEIYARIKDACQEAEKKPINPSIALGCATKKEITNDFELILKKAEDKMYQNKVHESKSFHNTILDSLETMLRETTNETLEHSQRLEDLAVGLGKELDLSQHELDVLVSLSNLHDLGKITISKDILEKPGPLTNKEWEEIKRHPETGYKIASSSNKLSQIAEVILYHHEHWDGKGYPSGFKGEEIPLLARIISIIDAYDVMTNGRPYKEPISKKDALEELNRCSGSQFDPELVKIFMDMMKTS